MACRTVLSLIVAAVLTAPAAVAAGHSGHHSSHPAAGSHSKKAAGVPRDRHGRIKRSSTAREQFQRAHPCPSTGKSSGACPGYVVDHVVPLKRGGADAPANMQWQTKAAARAKDKVE